MSFHGIPIHGLFDYCVKNNITNFEASEENGIIVSIPATFSTTDAEQDEHYLPCRFKACHTLENLNGSFISDDAMEAALPSFSEKPILASIVEIKDENNAATLDFNGHDMIITQDKMNPENDRVEYVEKIVGIIPDKNNIELVQDKDSDKKYVYVDGLIFREYTYAADILEKRKTVNVSVELNVKKYSFDTKNKRISIDDFTFFGITLLGSHVKPGMEGANAALNTFSKKDTSTELKNILSEFQTLLYELKKDNKKGGTPNLKLQELLKKYNKTEQDITFEIDTLTDDELEIAFQDAFGKEYDNHNKIISYEISHDDIRQGLYHLLNENVAEDMYYNLWIVEVYNAHFIYEDYYNKKYFNQKYTIDGENISFDGEPVEVFAEFVTAEEKATLDLMKATYEELKTFKDNADLQSERTKKEEILENEKFSILAGNTDFELLKADIDKYSVSEIEEKAKCIFSNFVYENPAVFANLENRKSGKIAFSDKTDEKSDRYGNLFD